MLGSCCGRGAPAPLPAPLAILFDAAPPASRWWWLPPTSALTPTPTRPTGLPLLLPMLLPPPAPPPGIAVMDIAPVVAVAADASGGADDGGEVKALAVRLFGMIHGGREEPLLSPRAGVLKQLLCWESLQVCHSVVHPGFLGNWQEVEAGTAR